MVGRGRLKAMSSDVEFDLDSGHQSAMLAWHFVGCFSFYMASSYTAQG